MELKRMKEKPLISAIIPTYNGSTTIKRAIKSVLNQTYPNIEVIIVDDSSKDNTVEVINAIKDERIRLLRHKENRNGAAARNTGMRVVKGEYIAFLDDDDEWLPKKLERQMVSLKTKKDFEEWKGVVCSHFMVSNQRSRKILLKKEGDVSKDIFLMTMSLAGGSSFLIHKEVISEIGFFDEKYSRHQDLEYILRYLRKFKLAVVREPLVRIYGHSGYVSGEKLLRVKQRFLKDFKKDIDQFEEKVSNKIYSRQWLQVSKHYALDGDLTNNFKYFLKSISYAVLFSNRIKFLLLENYFVLPYYLLRGIITKKRKRGKR